MAKYKGNSCLLFLQRVSNIALLVISLGFIGIGGFLIQTTKDVSVFPMVFICIGVLQIILAFLAFCKDASKSALSCYTYSLLALVGAQAVSALISFIYIQQILDWAAQNYSNDQKTAEKFKEMIKGDVYLAEYLALAASGVQVLCLIVTCCYSGTIKRIGLKDNLMSDSVHENDLEDQSGSYNEKKERKKLEERKKQMRAEYRANQQNYRDMLGS